MVSSWISLSNVSMCHYVILSIWVYDFFNRHNLFLFDSFSHIKITQEFGTCPMEGKNLPMLSYIVHFTAVLWVKFQTSGQIRNQLGPQQNWTDISLGVRVCWVLLWIKAMAVGPGKPNVYMTSFSLLNHWGRDKIDAISQTTFSNAFSWMKMFELRLKFHWSLFLRVQLTIFQHWFR